MNDEEMSGELTFAEFQRVSAERSARWHPGGVNEWSDAEWIVCLTGELGELCGWLKERWRNRDRALGKGMTTREIDTAIRKEVADVLAYLCMFAESEGIDLAEATVSKFNEVSERFGFPERLGNPERSFRFEIQDWSGDGVARSLIIDDREQAEQLHLKLGRYLQATL